MQLQDILIFHEMNTLACFRSSILERQFHSDIPLTLLQEQLTTKLIMRKAATLCLPEININSLILTSQQSIRTIQSCIVQFRHLWEKTLVVASQIMQISTTSEWVSFVRTIQDPQRTMLCTMKDKALRQTNCNTETTKSLSLDQKPHPFNNLD